RERQGIASGHVAHHIRALHVRVAEGIGKWDGPVGIERPLLYPLVEREQEGDLDQAGGGEEFVRTERGAGAGGEMADIDADDPAEARGEALKGSCQQGIRAEVGARIPGKRPLRGGRGRGEEEQRQRQARGAVHDATSASYCCVGVPARITSSTRV